jgi:hypothetical protein
MSAFDVIEKRYKGQFVSNDELVDYALEQDMGIKPTTATWTIDKMIKDGRAFRAGRGVYGLFKKTIYSPKLSQDVIKAVDLLSDSFRYLGMTVTEISTLNEFTELQSFTSPIIIETDKAALESVLSKLRKNGFDAFLAKDIDAIDRYSGDGNPFILKRLPKSSPLVTVNDNITTSTLEKLLVDVFCDGEDYMGYDPAMTQEVYGNATTRYAVNYSRLLRYANTRRKRQEIEKLLLDTPEYPKVKELLK